MLVFGKVIGFLSWLPGFGQREIPHSIRIVLAVALTIVITPIVEAGLQIDHANFALFLVILVREVLVGCFLGIICKVMLLALELVGQHVGSLSSLSSANILNPSFEHQTPIHSNFLLVVAGTALMASEFHHQLIHGLVESYRLFHLNENLPWSDWADGMTQMVGQSFAYGFQLSIPFIILGLVFQMVAGLLNRLLPQIPIFYMMMPAQILLGHLAFWMLSSVLVGAFLQFFEDAYSRLFFEAS